MGGGGEGGAGRKNARHMHAPHTHKHAYGRDPLRQNGHPRPTKHTQAKSFIQQLVHPLKEIHRSGCLRAPPRSAPARSAPSPRTHCHLSTITPYTTPRGEPQALSQPDTHRDSSCPASPERSMRLLCKLRHSSRQHIHAKQATTE